MENAKRNKPAGDNIKKMKMAKKQAKAELNRLRISPRKVRLVVDLIRGKKAEEARNILRFTPKKVTQPLEKLLNSAIANARLQQLEEEKLFVQKIWVDEGRKFKRFRPVSRGRTTPIAKRTSRVSIVLEEYGS